MNGLLLLLLCVTSISVPITGMESSLTLLVDAAVSPKESNRVPKLKELVLSQLVSDLVQQKDGTLLEKIKNSYSGAESDCARVLAEDQRVLLWKIFFGSQQKSVKIEHTPLKYEHGRENSVFAAAFTPNNKFLITAGCSCDDEPHYMVYVWRTADIDSLMRGDGSVSDKAESVTAKKESQHEVQPVLKEPCSSFDLGRVENYSSGFEIICHPNSRMIIVEVPDEDNYCLTLDDEGRLDRLWRLNLLPAAKALNALEGSAEERRLVEKHPFGNSGGPYRRSFSFNESGSHLLIHVWDDSFKTADLYCYSLEDLTRLQGAPAINGLDDTVKIAENVGSVIWQYNDRILIIDIKNNSKLRVINPKGEVLDEKELKFELVSKSPLRADKLKLQKNRDKLLIFSDYACDVIHMGGRDFRIDRCDLRTGDCELVREASRDKIMIKSFFDLEFLDDERFALLLSHNMGCCVNLWDFKTNSGVEIAKKALNSGLYSYAFTASNGCLFLVDRTYCFLNDRHPNLSDCISIETPLCRKLTFEELLIICSLDKEGYLLFRDNAKHKSIYENMGSSSENTASESLAIKKAVHEYFNRRYGILEN